MCVFMCIHNTLHEKHMDAVLCGLLYYGVLETHKGKKNASSSAKQRNAGHRRQPKHIVLGKASVLKSASTLIRLLHSQRPQSVMPFLSICRVGWQLVLATTQAGL